MKLIKPSTEILTKIDGEQILKDIEIAARTCYKSEGKIEIGHRSINGELYDLEAISARPLIKMLIAKGHEAMLEFGGNITVKFITDRGVSHELVRHRIASFAQESTRYCNYGKDDHITFIIPCWDDETKEGIYNITGAVNNLVCKEISGTHTKEIHNIWFWQCAYAESAYNRMITKQIHAQQARSVLPNSVKTEINVSTNIRDWRHIFKLRTSKAAHPQMRELMIPLLAEFKSRIPVLFDDINPE